MTDSHIFYFWRRLHFDILTHSVLSQILDVDGHARVGRSCFRISEFQISPLTPAVTEAFHSVELHIAVIEGHVGQLGGPGVEEDRPASGEYLLLVEPVGDPVVDSSGLPSHRQLEQRVATE